MFPQALADVKKELPACLVITTIVMVIHEVTDYDKFNPISWLITAALTVLTLYLLYAAFIFLSRLKKRRYLIAAALLVLCVVIRSYWPPWSPSHLERHAKQIVQVHELQDTSAANLETTRSLMEDIYDGVAKHMSELPIAERRDFLESIRANMDDDSNHHNIVITDFIAAMYERGVHMKKELHLHLEP